MRAPFRLALCCVLVGAPSSGCGWWNSPERQIRRALDEIAERLTHDKPLTTLAAAAAAAGLQQSLSPDIVVEADTPVLALTGRDAVVGAANRLIASTPALRVRFVDVKVALRSAEAGDRADVTCNVTAATEDRAGQESRDARELNLIMRRMNGRWVIERMKAVSVLEPVS